MKRLGALLFVAGVAAGVVAGRLSRPEPAAVAAAPVAGTSVCPSGLSRADVARLRGEMASVIDERLGGGEVRAVEAPPLPEEVATVATVAPATTEALAHIERAVASGRWTEDDERQLRAGMARLSPEGREQAMRTFYTAMNSGRLRVETDPSRFEP